jgi:hypothetical protein
MKGEKKTGTYEIARRKNINKGRQGENVFMLTANMLQNRLSF